MKLHIIRHAKTDSYSSTGKDIDRPLLPEGIKQANELREYFNTVNEIETIWCSEARRTKQTAEIVLNDTHPAPEYEHDLYLASKQTMLQLLWNFKSAGDLLIIGHNFGISDLTHYLTGEYVQLETAEYVCIEFNCDSWTETSMGTGTIVDRYHPKAFS